MDYFIENLKTKKNINCACIANHNNYSCIEKTANKPGVTNPLLYIPFDINFEQVSYIQIKYSDLFSLFKYFCIIDHKWISSTRQNDSIIEIQNFIMNLRVRMMHKHDLINSNLLSFVYCSF